MSEPVLKSEHKTGVKACLESAKSVFRALNKPSAIVDSDYKVVFVNKTWTRLAAMPEDEYLGKNLDMMIHPKEVDSLIQIFGSQEAQGTRLKLRIRNGHDTYG